MKSNFFNLKHLIWQIQNNVHQGLREQQQIPPQGRVTIEGQVQERLTTSSYDTKRN